MSEHDTVIVGAGPIGLELAVCLKHAGVDVVQLEAGHVAQTVTWYPKQTTYFSSPDRIAIAGLPLNTHDQSKATREQYLAYLRGVVQHFGLKIRTHEKLIKIDRRDDGRFELTTTFDTLTAKYVVLAIGDMHHPRKLDIPGEEMEHVSHYFSEPHDYFQRKLLIVGGKNSAVEAALRCFHAGVEVSISYRRAEFDRDSIKYWLYPELKSLIKHGKIAFHSETLPIEIEPGRVMLEKVSGPHRDGERIAVDANAVLLLTGYAQDKTLFEQAGIELVGENRSPKHDLDTMMTNVLNLFVAGTAVAGTQNKFKLFIENCHIHAAKITKAITGQAPPAELINDAAETYGLPES
jgi:thioredoxin reductase (NADPH)